MKNVHIRLTLNSIFLPNNKPQQVIAVVLALQILHLGQNVDGEPISLASLLITSVHVVTTSCVKTEIKTRIS